MASEKYEKARKETEAFMAGGVALTFPAFDNLPEKKVFFGTRKFEVDGDAYEPALADMPYIRTQRGIGQDGSDFSVNDAKSLWYDGLKPYEDVVVDTECVVKECLKTEDGVFESEIVLTGFLEQMDLNESSMQLQFTAAADTSRTGFLVGGRILTQRYCAAKFNKNGLRNPLYDPCGWIPELGGNPLFCSHKVGGVDGCRDHFNEPRYFAVEALTSAEITTVSGGGLGGGGFGYGGNCFTPKTLVWMWDGSYKPIYQVKADDIVKSFSPVGKLVPGKVRETYTHVAGNHLVFDFGKGIRLEPTAEHLFAIEPDLFKPAVALDSGDTVINFAKSDWKIKPIRRTWLNEKLTRVHNFAVERWQTYIVADENRQIRIGVHNVKYGDPFQV